MKVLVPKPPGSLADFEQFMKGGGAGQALRMVLAAHDADHLAWAPTKRKDISLKEEVTAHFRDRYLPTGFLAVDCCPLPSSGSHSGIGRKIETISRVLSVVYSCTSLLGCSLGRWLYHERTVSWEACPGGWASFVQPLSSGITHLFQVRTITPVGSKFRKQWGLRGGQEGAADCCLWRPPENSTWDLLP